MPLPNFISRKYFFGAALCAWMGGIFLLSSLPGVGTSFEPPLWYVLERKGAHIFEYAILAILLALFLSTCSKFQAVGRNFFGVVFLFGIAYAFSDEIHQLFVFGRSGRFSDVLVDAIGLLIGIFFSVNRSWVQFRKE